MGVVVSYVLNSVIWRPSNQRHFCNNDNIIIVLCFGLSKNCLKITQLKSTAWKYGDPFFLFATLVGKSRERSVLNKISVQQTNCKYIQYLNNRSQSDNYFRQKFETFGLFESTHVAAKLLEIFQYFEIFQFGLIGGTTGSVVFFCSMFRGILLPKIFKTSENFWKLF
eukprot:TRINITY_DN9550_c0_g2_i3.p4 TRINITY_DN9550_c0_g2~~TRINITY_DN9550_c0_g2_i3.p4  ORF type:complete len:167 (+),score=8.91 TRINITY_DN9550_c0_g2_i3:900-1400(+)